MIRPLRAGNDPRDPAGTGSTDRGAIVTTLSRSAAPRCDSELAFQARVVRGLGSPFVAAVLEAGERQLARAPLTAALIASWPGDRAAAALAMRFNAALHAIARRGSSPALSALYRREHDAFDDAVGDALAREDAFIATWMLHPTQTNEVGRAAAIFAALLVVQRTFGLPMELLEIGSSAGLNLNLARYAYDLGGVEAGAAASPVRIAPTWTGSLPPAGAIDVVSANGVDLRPLDVADAATRERLLCYSFADQHERAVRLHEALELAALHPPAVDRADAATWLAERLALQQPAGRCRIVFHSMVTQYLTPRDRHATVSVIEDAGARAGVANPLARIGFEWTADRSEVRLLLTEWPTGGTRHLATCHPYGAAIDWHLNTAD